MFSLGLGMGLGTISRAASQDITYLNTTGLVDDDGNLLVNDDGNILTAEEDSTVPPHLWTGCFFAPLLNCSVSRSQEILTSQGSTAANDGDLLGQVPDASDGGFLCGAPSTGTRPTLVTEIMGRHAAVLFSGSQYLTTDESKAAFGIIPKTGIGSIVFWISPTDATAGRVISNNRDSGSQVGIEVDKNANGTISIYVTNGAGNNFSGTTVDVVSVGVWKCVIIRLTGPGTNTGKIRIGGGSDVLFNEIFSSGGAWPTTNAPDQITFGRRSDSGTAFLKAYMTVPMFFDRALTDAEVTILESYNPGLTSVVQNTAPTTGHYKFYDYDHIFTDTNATINPTGDGESIKVAEHVWSGDRDIGRNMTSAGVTDPITASPSGASVPAIQWGTSDRTTDRLRRTNVFPPLRECSWKIIARQRRNDLTSDGQGSQILNSSAGSSNYLTVVSSSSTEDPVHPGKRVVAHDSVGTPALGSIAPDGATLDENHFNVIWITRSGQTCKLYVNGILVATATMTGSFNWNEIGGSGSAAANWELWGWVIELAGYAYCATAAQIEEDYDNAPANYGIT